MESAIYLLTSSNQLPHKSIHLMVYWYERFWFYSIPPLCIFGSIGIFKILKKLNDIKLYKKKKSLLLSIKLALPLMLITFSYSGIAITGLGFGIPNYRITDDKVKMVGWISENIPYNSRVLIYNDFQITYCFKSMTYCKGYFIEYIFKEEYNQTQLIQKLGYLKFRNIKYALISQGYLSIYWNISTFVNDYLIPTFYNNTMYQSGDLTLYNTSLIT
jgi:hypothetical protein